MSFLTDRTFSVKINNYYYQNLTLKYGVPRGSVLGPLLFSIYLNPISDIIKKYKSLKRHLYADDILIYSINKSNNFSDDLSQCPNEINQWLLKNK